MLRGILPGGIGLLLLFLQYQVSEISCEGKLSVKFVRYENPTQFKYNLNCCDGELRFGQCTGGCDHKVSVCIDHFNSTAVTCSLGQYDIGGAAFDEASFNFSSFFRGGLPNPYPISLDSWEGGILIKVEMYDQDTGSDEIVDEFVYRYKNSQPVIGWTPDQDDHSELINLTGLRPVVPSRLTIALEAYCDANYYGPNCSINCVPEDDCLGHYTCNETTGERICLPGWYGQNCATKIPGVEDCTPEQNCNQGTCVPQGGNSSLYYCCCNQGYTGDNCDQDIDECAALPCQNGGTCIQDKPASFQCNCPIQYTGPNCEREKLCTDNPCLNGGMCFTTESGGFQCACVQGFTGYICEYTATTSTTIQVTTVLPSTTTTSTPRPFCEPNYYGPTCSVYCKADDTCDAGFYSCDPVTGSKVCSDGWMGPNCNIKDNNYVSDTDCPESFCRNGGYCKNSTCCCPSGFMGRLCHIEILECDSNPCINGRCKDRIGDYFCECQDGYSGRNCEQVVTDAVLTTDATQSNPCDSISCDNGGICVDDDNVGPVCLCPKGYDGPSCGNSTNAVTNTVCSENMYGPECDVLCIPTDSCAEGHYECHYLTGDKVCHAGWGGEYCQERILSPRTDPECPANDCRNGGQCYNGSCCCTAGYQGQYCEQEVFACSTKPCQNRGRCIELVNGFDCICQPGFTGDLCEIVTVSEQIPSTTDQSVARNSSSSSTEGLQTVTSIVSQVSSSDGVVVTESSTASSTTRVSTATTQSFVASDRSTQNTYGPTTSDGSETSTNEITPTVYVQTNGTKQISSQNGQDIPTEATTTVPSYSTGSSTTMAADETTATIGSAQTTDQFMTSPVMSSLSESTMTTTISTDGHQIVTDQQGSTEMETTSVGTTAKQAAGMTSETTPQRTPTTTTTVSTTPEMTTYASTQFVETLYMLKWWKFLSDDQVSDVLRYAIYLTNLKTVSGIQQESIEIQPLEKHDNLDQRGRNVAELLYNASLAGRLEGPLRPPTVASLTAAINNRGYNIRLYDGPTPWRYIYHYDLYYKVSKSETTRTVISRLNRAWLQKYPEYKTCECKFEIRVPRRVRYLDRNGQIITRFIYFVLVNDKLNNPSVQPGPTISELAGFFPTVDGNVAVLDAQNLTEYSQHHVIFLNGNETESDKHNLAGVIETAIQNSTDLGQKCGELDVNVARTELHIDATGKTVTKVMYTVRCDTTLVDISSNESDILNVVDDVLQRQDEGGRSVYRDDKMIFDSKDSYAIYLNGELNGSLEKAILEAWKKGSKDIVNCNCQVTVYVLKARRFVGIYGIQVTGVTYFIAKDGEFLNPDVSSPPDKAVFQNALADVKVYNTLYRGSEIKPYDLHYTVLVNNALPKEKQLDFTKQISSSWEESLSATKLQCAGCSLRVALSKPDVYFTASGEPLSRVAYYLKWGNNVISPKETAPPSVQILTNNGINLCGCQGIRSRYLTVNGRLSYSQKTEVQSKIKTIWNKRYPGSVVEFKGSQEFVDTNGEDVTQIHFTVSVSRRDVTETLLQFPVAENIASQLLPYEPTSIPSHRVYSVNLLNGPTEDRTKLEGAIKKSWLEANKEVAVDAVSVKILDQSNNYINSDGATVTKVRYTVSVLDADSSITNVEQPTTAVYKTSLEESGFDVCICVPKKIREFYITGDTDDNSLQNAIATAWRKNNPDFNGTLTTTVVSKTNGFQSSADGTKLTKVVYTVTPDVDRTSIRSTDLSEPNNSELNDELQVISPDITTYDGDVIKEKVETEPDWIIPVVIVVCLLILVLIIVVIILFIRHRRNRQSRTLKRRPEEIRGFDKEHFSTEPDFDNPAYDANEVSQKTDSHYLD